MAQNRMTQQAPLDHLDDADTDVLRRVLVAGSHATLGELLPVAPRTTAAHRPGAAGGVQEAYVLRISTRKVDDPMAALGGCSISRSEVSRICALLDEGLAEFRDRPLDEEPYRLT